MFPLEKIGANANIKVIGITGHVSSGKSTLLGALGNMGVSTLSVDTIIHNLYNTNEELINKIIVLLGDDILTNNMLDKKLIAKKVFNDKGLLFKLENPYYPLCYRPYQRRCKYLQRSFSCRDTSSF